MIPNYPDDLAGRADTPESGAGAAFLIFMALCIGAMAFFWPWLEPLIKALWLHLVRI